MPVKSTEILNEIDEAAAKWNSVNNFCNSAPGRDSHSGEDATETAAARAIHPTRIQRAEVLLLKLQVEERLRTAPFRAFITEGGGVAVYLHGSFRGIWMWDKGAYAWIPAAYGTVQFRAPDAGQAASHTGFVMFGMGSRQI